MTFKLKLLYDAQQTEPKNSHLALGYLFCKKTKASSKDIPFVFIKYANTTAELLDIPERL